MWGSKTQPCGRHSIPPSTYHTWQGFWCGGHLVAQTATYVEKNAVQDLDIFKDWVLSQEMGIMRHRAIS